MHPRIILPVLALTTAASVPVAGVPAHAVAPEPAQPVRTGTVLHPIPVVSELPVRGYRLTGRFGASSSLWSSGRHTGLDFAAPTGTSIRALGRGLVVSAGYDGRYGNKTVLRLSDGTELWFCHQDALLVSSGRRVRAGEVIGTVGSTGNVTGPHLHLEVHPAGGLAVDPAVWLRHHGLLP